MRSLIPLDPRLLAVMSLLSFPVLAATGGIRLESRTDFVINDVSGAGSASSFLDDGAHVLQELDLRYSDTLGNDYKSLFTANVRFTDSPQFDSEKASIERLSWRLKNSVQSFTLGDTFATLSPYTMNKGIKGFNYQRNLDADGFSYVRAAFGAFDSQWEYLYKDVTDEPMNRYGGGLRYQRGNRNYHVGFNLAYTDDDAKDPNRGSVTAYRQKLPAVDWAFRKGGWRFSGEHAYASTDAKDRSGATSHQSGTANRIKATGRAGPFRVRGRLERVSPNFVSVGGGATADRLRAYLRVSSKVGRYWNLFVVDSYYHNDVEGQLGSRLRVNSMELGLRKRRLFDRRHMKLSVSLRRKHSRESDNSQDRTTDRIKLSLSDRVARVLRVRGDVEYIVNNDDVDNQSPQDWFYHLRFNSRHRLENGWELKPLLDLSRRESEPTTGGGEDVSDQLRLGLHGQRPGGRRFGLDLDAGRVRPAGSGSTDSDTRRLTLFWEERPRMLRKGTVRLEFNDNDYDFSDDTQDYRERIVKLSVRFALR